jgi:hypothetical protein
MPVKKDIIYPFFFECCPYTTELFWENIFEDLSYGICPKGIYITKDHYLTCSQKGKEFSYKIQRKDAKKLYTDIYALLKDSADVCSNKELLEKKNNFYQVEKDIKHSSSEWKKIRKKNIKDMLYENFVLDMKDKFCLDTKQTKYLFSIISISILFKTLTSKDINYDDNKIESINGLEFKKGEIIVNMSLYNKNILYAPEEEEKKNIYHLWEKYLDSLV